jgi:Fn3 associated
MDCSDSCCHCIQGGWIRVSAQTSYTVCACFLTLKLLKTHHAYSHSCLLPVFVLSAQHSLHNNNTNNNDNNNNNNNSIIAKAQPPAADGSTTVLGVSTTNPSILQTTITGLVPTVAYVVEVRGRNAEGALSLPLAAAGNAGATRSPAGAPTDATRPPVPDVKFDAKQNLITISGGGEVYYTLNGVDPVSNGDTISQDAFLYKGPFTLTEANVNGAPSITITVRAITLNSFVSASVVQELPITTAIATTPPPTVVQPGPPTVTAVPGSGSIIVTAVPVTAVPPTDIIRTERLRITVSFYYFIHLVNLLR